jgi:hypothetical protein
MKISGVSDIYIPTKREKLSMLRKNVQVMVTGLKVEVEK